MQKAVFYDRKVRSWVWQALLACAVIGGLLWLAGNAAHNLARRGIAGGFEFLSQAARFPISESVLNYETTDTFARAFAVGITNTLVISGLVIVLSTLLGLGLALMRRARHPVLSGAASVYVEVVRNTPLVVQLLFWYGVLTVNLPSAAQALRPVDGVYLSVRGLIVPRIEWSGSLSVLALFALVAVVLLVAAWRWRGRLGSSARVMAVAGALAVLLLVVGCQVSGLVLGLNIPSQEGLGFVGGITLTPEFTALLVGLVVYSTAFSGEVIRGGINAIGRGQWEAGESLGLRRGQVLRLIVFPQALRAIVPPMTSQYLSITKNSTLALAVGYPDLSFVVATTINQTGQAVEGILILMGTFLSISLAVSVFMNWYNRRVMRWHR